MNPVWKSVDKTKWRNPRGMSYEGQLAHHVSTNRTSLLGGTGLAKTFLDGKKNKNNRGGSSWQMTKNEDA